MDVIHRSMLGIISLAARFCNPGTSHTLCNAALIADGQMHARFKSHHRLSNAEPEDQIGTR